MLKGRIMPHGCKLGHECQRPWPAQSLPASGNCVGGLRLQIPMEYLTQHAPRKVARSHPKMDHASQALQNDPGWTSRLIGVIKMNRSIISTLRKSAQTTPLMLRQIQRVLLIQHMCMLDYCNVGC